LHPFGTAPVHIGAASGAAPVYHHADPAIDRSENRNLLQFFFANVTQRMIRKENAGQHYIHDRSVVGYDNIGLIFIDLGSRFSDESVSESHPVKHSDSPQSDKEITGFIVLLAERQRVHRQEKYKRQDGAQNHHPKSPKVYQYCPHQCIRKIIKSKNRLLSIKYDLFLNRIIEHGNQKYGRNLTHHFRRNHIKTKVYNSCEHKVIEQLENNQADESRNYGDRNKIEELFFLRMFSSFEDKPYAQKVIGDDSATRRENIAKRIFNSIKIIFRCKDSGKVYAQYFETPDFHNGTQSACDNKEDDLFLTKN